MFRKAQPVWIRDREREMNVYAVFCTRVDLSAPGQLLLAGTAFYRVTVNGKFLAFGPARTAEGYVRQDVLTLPEGVCDIQIEACGYYCHSLSTVWQPSFLMAEVRCDGEVLSYTGRDFEAYTPGTRLQKVERYSMQRHFSEIWDFCQPQKNPAQIAVQTVAPKVIRRNAPYPEYAQREVIDAKCCGTLTFDETLPYKTRRYSWTQEGWGEFPAEEILYSPHTWLQRQRQTPLCCDISLPMILQAGEYAILDLEQIETGFLTASVTAEEESDVVIGFTEYFSGDIFRFSNMNVHNVIEYFLPVGTRQLQSFEPYTLRFAIVAVKKGKLCLEKFGVKTFQFDLSDVCLPELNDPVLTDIYQAAARTFAHNAVDIYMDCPSRERAGWLCDSYFTAKTEYALTGRTGVEDDFLENYRLFPGNELLPKGVVPECYPGDPPKGGEFIPQWTMWYILQVEEYIRKRGHEDKAEAFRESIYGLLDFYRQYENSDGLLEKLPGWNFVEWSIANQWTQDVNYPTNFLYAQVLECVDALYGDEYCRRRSREVREKAVQQSYNGTYFMDHALRDETGALVLQDHASEACQYYAVLFGGIDLEHPRYAKLKELILNVFSPDRGGKMPEIFEVNAFIGAYLRLEALLKMGQKELVLSDIRSFFGQMSEHTGTLWEYRQEKGSKDHGFASYALVAIEEALR